MTTPAPHTPDEHIPVEVSPLAMFLAEEMEERGWTASDVARRMGGDDLQMDLLALRMLLAVQDDGLLVGDLFAGLSNAFGASEQLFRNLDAVWRKYPDRRVPFKCPEELLA